MKYFGIIILCAILVFTAQACKKDENPAPSSKDFQKYVDKSKGKTWDIVIIKDCQYLATKSNTYSDGTIQFIYEHCGDCINPKHGLKQ